jgi:NADH-quinone oxidoreductase subunit L
MVAAGTFVLAQLFDLLAAAEGARWLLAASTAVTMVYAAVLAFGQSDLKRLLAYSTLSQVALMLSALAVAPSDEGPGAGVLHLYSHAFFKALLFLAIGWLSVTVGGTAATTMRGGVRGHLFIRPAMFVGLLSLAGVPPLVGFVSKEHVLAAAEAGVGAGEARAWLVLLAGLLTVALTAAYCMRAWLVLDDLGAADLERHDGDTATPGVRTVVTVLAVLTVVGGLVVVTPLLDLGGHIGWLVALLSILLIVGAGLAVRSVADGKDPAIRVVGARMPSFAAGLGVDRLYVTLVARPVLALARLVVFLDREVVDAYVRGAAAATRLGGSGGQRAHRTERAASGLAWVVAGVVAVALAGVALW